MGGTQYRTQKQGPIGTKTMHHGFSFVGERKRIAREKKIVGGESNWDDKRTCKNLGWYWRSERVN